MSLQVVTADLEEVDRLIASTTRTAVKDHLQQLQKKLTAEKSKLEAAAASAAAAAAASAAAASSGASGGADVAAATASAPATFTPISKYGWDQEGMNVTIYITDFPGVHEIPREQVKANFEKQSLDLQVHGLRGTNYRLRIPLFHDAIDVSKCKCLVRENRITLKMVKAKSGYWSKLLAEPGAKPAAKTEDDASNGLMDLMKKMYDEGDDEMKRTIAKAWTESRQKQESGAMF